MRLDPRSELHVSQRRGQLSVSQRREDRTHKITLHHSEALVLADALVDAVEATR